MPKALDALDARVSLDGFLWACNTHADSMCLLTSKNSLDAAVILTEHHGFAGLMWSLEQTRRILSSVLLKSQASYRHSYAFPKAKAEPSLHKHEPTWCCRVSSGKTAPCGCLQMELFAACVCTLVCSADRLQVICHSASCVALSMNVQS